VVIAMLLSLTTVLLLGARAWKSGADRAGCILTVRNVQTSVRSYQNIYGYTPGSMPYAEGGSQDIAAHMFAKGYINGKTYDAVQGFEPCASGGHYERPHPDVFPLPGQLYISCSLASIQNHIPEVSADW